MNFHHLNGVSKLKFHPEKTANFHYGTGICACCGGFYCPNKYDFLVRNDGIVVYVGPVGEFPKEPATPDQAKDQNKPYWIEQFQIGDEVVYIKHAKAHDE